MRRLLVSLIACIVVAETVSTLLSTAACQDTIESGAVVIAIPFDGEFYVNKEQIKQSEIVAKLRATFLDVATENQIVYIKAAQRVRYGTVVSLIDALREAGFNRIGLVGDKKKKDGGGGTREKIANSKEPPTAPETTIVIDVRSKTQLFINSTKVTLIRLGPSLQNLLNGRSDKTIFIKAPKNMFYGNVLNVIDIAKEVGAAPIGLQVDQLR